MISFSDDITTMKWWQWRNTLFTCILRHVTLQISTRKILFSQDNQPIENISLTQKALVQNNLRFALQSSK